MPKTNHAREGDIGSLGANSGEAATKRGRAKSRQCHGAAATKKWNIDTIGCEDGAKDGNCCSDDVVAIGLRDAAVSKIGAVVLEIYWEVKHENRIGVGPEHLEYRRRAHLAEIIGLLGLPPKDLLAQGQLGNKFFSDEGK